VESGDEYGSLEDVYENALMRTNGHSIQYENLQLEKVEWPHPEHTEYSVYNRNGEKIESLTISAFDSLEDLENLLNDIAEYEPEDMDDWLEYRREQRRGENL
jgi:hypothetical protein